MLETLTYNSEAEMISLGTARAELREVMSKLIDNDKELRMLAQDADIEIQHIELGGSVALQWHSILLEAEKSEREGAVINAVKRRYGENRSFQRAYEIYVLAIANERNKSFRPSHTSFLVVIDGEFPDLVEQIQLNLPKKIDHFLNLPAGTCIIYPSPGSIQLMVDVPKSKVSQLYSIIQSGEFDRLTETKTLRTDLSRVDLSSLNLHQDNLSNAILRMADLRGTNLSNVNLHNTIVDQSIYLSRMKDRFLWVFFLPR